MDDQPQSSSVPHLGGWDNIDEFDPAWDLGVLSEDDILELLKEPLWTAATSPTQAQQEPQEEQQQQYVQQQRHHHQDPGELGEEKKEQFVQQQQRIQQEQDIRHIPPAESSMKPDLPPPSSDLDDSNSIEESLSVSTTSTSTRHGGNVYDKVTARNTNCTTWSTTSASEESDDGSISSCTAPIVISNDKDQRHVKGEFTGRGSTLDYGQSKPSTSTSSRAGDHGHDENKPKPLEVSSGVGTPILPFTFAPVFGPLGGNNPMATAAISVLPDLRELASAATTGWKRLRSPEINAEGGRTGGPQDNGQPRLLSSSARKGQATGPNSRVNKRAKKEERLMKNREAANRSRIKRKEVLSELENRATTLSRSLASSREENDTLKQEIASLREQNSFLRGMLSATGIANELPPVLPTSTIRQQQNGIGGGGGVRAATGANAVVGAIGTALAVVSCVALSATGYDVESGIHNNSDIAPTAGRRTLMSVDDFGRTPGSDYSASWFDAGLRYVMRPEVMQLIGIIVVLAVVLSLLFFVVREAYDVAVRQVNSRGRRMSVMSKAFSTKSRRSGSLWIDSGGCKVQ